jgi:hypothetical protein
MTRQDPYLLDCSKPVQQQLLLGFAARIRQGYFGCGTHVQSQTPETALRHVVQALVVLAEYPAPAGHTDPKTLIFPSPVSSEPTKTTTQQPPSQS